MRVFSAIVLSLLVSSQSIYAAPKPSSSSNSLREFVKQTAGRQAYGLYLWNQKAGWMLMETKLATIREGKRTREVALQTSAAQIRIRVPGASTEQTTMEMYESTTFALAGDGPILQAHERMNEGGRETVYNLKRTAAGYVLETKSPGRNQRQRVIAPRETLEQSRRLWKWLLSRPNSGAKFSSVTTSLGEENRDTDVKFDYLSRRVMVWGGLPTVVHKVRMNMSGANFDTEIKSDGTPITGRMAGVFEIRAEDEKIARQWNGKGVDMLAASSIKVDQRLGAPQQVQALTLQVEGLGDFQLPQSHRQRLQKDGTRTLLKMVADSPGTRVEPLSATQRPRYLRATSTLQSDDAQMKKLARQIVGNETNSLRKAEKLQSWVYRNLRKTMASNASTSLAVLHNRAGDCTEHSLLFITLARAAGVPAREVGGLMYVDGGWLSAGIFGWHAWAEIHDGKRWVSIDPTWNEVFVDATHIKFSEGSDDMAWINVLGNVKLSVVDFKTRDTAKVAANASP